MNIITASCVDEALFRGLTLLENSGMRQSSRNGDVLVMPNPVMTVNERPMNRVSFNAKRNANPFFHLMEALWMLAGRNDSAFLDNFVSDFGKRFAEPDGHLHGAYGFRWRRHFALGNPPDQLETAVRLLRANPDDRRVVITMWNPEVDLGAYKSDIPCNTHIYCRVRQEPTVRGGDRTSDAVLDLTVCCRSNDAVWGAHGANAVHFSVLQEYLAARIGVGVGKLYQLSNNYHVYLNVLKDIWPMSTEGTDARTLERAYPVTRIVAYPDAFDRDLELFFNPAWRDNGDYINPFFKEVALPMAVAYHLWRGKNYADAHQIIGRAKHCDWITAAGLWFARQQVKMGMQMEKRNVS